MGALPAKLQFFCVFLVSWNVNMYRMLSGFLLQGFTFLLVSVVSITMRSVIGSPWVLYFLALPQSTHHLIHSLSLEAWLTGKVSLAFSSMLFRDVSDVDNTRS